MVDTSHTNSSPDRHFFMRFLFKTTKAEDFHSSGIRAPYQITLSGFAIQLFKCSRHSFMLRFMKAYNKTSFFKQCCDLPLCSENGRQQRIGPLWSSVAEPTSVTRVNPVLRTERFHPTPFITSFYIFVGST